MLQASEAALARPRAQRLPPSSFTATRRDPADARETIELELYDDLAAVEDEWRRFEETADCTVFQSFDWLSTWQRNIGRRQNITPVIVLGRRIDGELLFIIPLAVIPGVVRRLTFLGEKLCDYNAPLLAPDFSEAMTSTGFRELWAQICRVIQSRPQYRHDLIELTKMPTVVGGQNNPFMALDVRLHPSGAHLTHLQGSWDEFYQAKRSSATRRRDRSKRKRLGELGEVKFVTPPDVDDIAATLTTLVEQKSRAFTRMGVPNIFTPAGHREFYRDLATNSRSRALVHISRLDVGSIAAAVNLGLVFRGVYYHVLASYDDGEVSRYGPGAAHLRDLLSFAIARGCRSFDFTIGDESYKLEWSDTLLELYDHVTPATPRGWPLAAWTRSRRHLKRAIKQNPALWALVSRLRAALRPARTPLKVVPEGSGE